MTAVAVSTFLLSAVICQSGNNTASPAAEESPQVQFLKAQAAALIMHRGNPDRSRLTVTGEPVLRYSNPLGGGQGGSGATFLWLDRTRPLAAVSLSIHAADDHAYLECASLSTGPLVCLRND